MAKDYYEKDGKKYDPKNRERIIKQDGKTYRQNWLGQWVPDTDWVGNDKVERDWFGNPKIERDWIGNEKIERDWFGNPIVPPKKEKHKSGFFAGLETTSSADDGWGWLIGIFVVIAIIAVIVYAVVWAVMIALSFILSPGMLAMSIIKAILGLDLESLPMWAFSFVSSGAIVYGIWYKFKDRRMTRNVYLGVCGATTLLYLICLGLKFEFPTIVAANFFQTEEKRISTFCTVNVEVANIRSTPSKRAAVIGQTRFGERLEIISESGNWLLIKYQDIQGYIYRELVR